MNKLVSYLLLCSILAAALVMAHGTQADPPIKLVIIVAKGSPITNLSRAELKRTYLSDNVVVGGKKLVPFNFGPGTPERIGFDRAVLGMSEEVMQRFWIDRKVRGQPDAPRSLPSAPVVIKVATKFPGAIAYVSEKDLTPDVQPVMIDGTPYTSPAYPLTR